MQIICPQCGFDRELAEDKIPARAQVATCPKCKHKFRFRSIDPGIETVDLPKASPAETGPAAEAPAASDSAPLAGDIWEHLESMAAPAAAKASSKPAAPLPEEEVPFERLDVYGFFGGIAKTVRRALMEPARFFGSMPLKGFARPMVFSMLMAEVGVFFQMFWVAVGVDQMEQGLENMPRSMIFMLTLALAPLFTLVATYAQAGLFHFFLTLFKAGSRGMEATFRVVCYANSTILAMALPVAGPLVGIFWSLALLLIGTRATHGAGTARVLGAMGLLILFLAGFAAILYIAASRIPPAA